jgi:hypothetical protein
MPEVREHFPDIENMDLGMLHEKRAEIMSRANGNYETLDDDSLAELLQIGRTLRRKAASPGGVGKTKKPKVETSLDDLA